VPVVLTEQSHFYIPKYHLFLQNPKAVMGRSIAETAFIAVELEIAASMLNSP